MIFPAAYLAHGSALTILLIVAGLAGLSELAAEMAVIQGALLATFHAFSANARSLILQGHDDLNAERLLAKRAIAVPVAALASYGLCVGLAGVSEQLALVLIARRACEWLAEVRLCEIEVAGAWRAARRALVVQASLTVATAYFLVHEELRIPALGVFAISPLLVAAPRFARQAFRLPVLLGTLHGAFPHIGSTAIEGISTYVLRLVVFVIAGREMSGLLFTAFALGSFAAALFANIIGPTLALQRARNARHSTYVAVWLVTSAMAVVGAVLSVAVVLAGQPAWAGKPAYFWLALGLSLLGGAAMIAAQTLRLRLFDERQAEILFGPDVLRNLAAIVAAPLLYYVLSPAALGALYLVMGLLTLFFYWSATRQLRPDEHPRVSAILQAALSAGILFPLFFQLRGGIYHSPEAPVLDSGGSVMSLPLPISLLTCVAGIVLLARYGQAKLSLSTIFFLFVAMTLTSAVVSQGSVVDEVRKFLLLFQFLIPVFALVLGQMYGAGASALTAAAMGFAAVLALLVPVQLAHSVGSGVSQLRHDLWIFSIYQHLEYVPSVVVTAYSVSLFALWNEGRARRILMLLSPAVALYAASSYSTLAIALVAATAALFAAAGRREKGAQLCAFIMVLACAVFLYVNRNAHPLQQRFSTSAADTEQRLLQAPPSDVRPEIVLAVPGPLQTRLHYWTVYATGIAESARSALFGHVQPIERSRAPSAHNYYLDFVYNFGVLAFLPFAWLVCYTLMLLWRDRGSLREMPLLGLAAAVLFVLGVDNMFKVPLRQPYPGVFFFFLWGLLLAQLQARRARPR